MVVPSCKKLKHINLAPKVQPNLTIFSSLLSILCMSVDDLVPDLFWHFYANSVPLWGLVGSGFIWASFGI